MRLGVGQGLVRDGVQASGLTEDELRLFQIHTQDSNPYANRVANGEGEFLTGQDYWNQARNQADSDWTARIQDNYTREAAQINAQRQTEAAQASTTNNQREADNRASWRALERQSLTSNVAVDTGNALYIGEGGAAFGNRYMSPWKMGPTAQPIGMNEARIGGAVQGLGSFAEKMAIGTAKLAVNTTLTLGNALTFGVNGDNPVLQQAAIETGALFQGIHDVVTSPVETMGRISNYFGEREATAQSLDAAGRYSEAAAIRSESAADLITGIAGATSASRALGRAAGLDRFAIVMEDVSGLNLATQGQAGALGLRIVRMPEEILVKSAGEFRIATRDPLPNTIYNYKDIRYFTDSLARPIRVEGLVGDVAYGRLGIDTQIGKLGAQGDIGFHLFADSLGAGGGRLNVVPGSKVLNNGPYAQLEGVLRNARDTGERVFLRVDANYSRQSVRPDGFKATYQIGDGRIEVQRFNNR